jgi:hypothetical protein
MTKFQKLKLEVSLKYFATSGISFVTLVSFVAPKLTKSLCQSLKQKIQSANATILKTFKQFFP